MAHVVTEACINCRHTDCVETCPVDAFHAGPNFLVIDPEVCIDCAACVPACPVEAIYIDGDVPGSMHAYVALNAELALVWPEITIKEDALPDADHWATVTDKRAELKEAA